MGKKKLTLISLISTLFTALHIPFAFARPRSGFPILDEGISMISGLFYPSILLRNKTVQIGFFKFLYFIVIFSATNWVLNKMVFNKGGNDATGKRASAMIAFAFSGIAAWFMPSVVAQGLGAWVAAIFLAIFPLGLAGGVLYVAFAQLNKEAYEHWIGMALILIAIIFYSWLIALI